MSPRFDATKLWVCRCMQVSERTLNEAAATGEMRCLKDVIEQTGAGGGCNGCHNRLRAFIASGEAVVCG